MANKTSMLQSRWFGNRITKEQRSFTQMKNEVKHTAHSSYRCEYHLVFAPKYRRKVIYKALGRDIIEIIKKAVQEDESRDHRGRGLPRPHPSSGEYSIVHEYSTVCGDAQEQKRADNFR